ncbi:MAG: BREX-3 system P-loop-containing protein BrxF [Chloroflexi bacterium]|nr:BREX-3 system P-loop-containing protein BrxF [Chloroflexota bacterium]
MSVIEPLVAAARDTRRDFARLILVAGAAEVQRAHVLRGVAEQLGRPVLSLSCMLARALLDLGPQERALRLSAVLEDCLTAFEPPLVLDRLELLFEPSLKIAPLRLLLTASRTRTVVAAWPGPLQDGFLSYARPGHPEFHRISTGGTLCFSLDQIQPTQNEAPR